MKIQGFVPSAAPPAPPPQRRPPQHGIRHRVQQYVGIAMTNRFAVVRNVDPTQPQRSAGLEPVRIVSNTNAQRTGYLNSSHQSRAIILRLKITNNVV